MTPDPFRNETPDIPERFSRRRDLLLPFIERYKVPVLVHAIDSEDVFRTIIKEEGLLLPKDHASEKKTPYMEKLLGIDNGIYLSLGFVFLTSYGWRFNLIFDLSALKDCIYYGEPIIYRCYKAIIDHWDEHDQAHLDELTHKDPTCKEVIDSYLAQKRAVGEDAQFAFWKIEKELFDHMNSYSKKIEMVNIIRKTEQEHRLTYPSSYEDAQRAWEEQRTPEIISLQGMSLADNQHFIGFHIQGEIPTGISKELQRHYPDKIIFDGEKIQTVGNHFNQ